MQHFKREMKVNHPTNQEVYSIQFPRKSNDQPKSKSQLDLVRMLFSMFGNRNSDGGTTKVVRYHLRINLRCMVFTFLDQVLRISYPLENVDYTYYSERLSSNHLFTKNFK